jgi:hypothetical protein
VEARTPRLTSGRGQTGSSHIYDAIVFAGDK